MLLNVFPIPYYGHYGQDHSDGGLSQMCILTDYYDAMTGPDIIISIIMSQVSINLFTHLIRNKMKIQKKIV